MSFGGNVSISGTYYQTGGTISIGSGDTLTALAAAQFGPYGTGEVDGPGTLSTKGTTTINEGIYLGGGLSWNNSGTVNDTSDIAGGDTNGGTATLTNLVGASFNITSDYLSIYNAVYTASGKTQTGALTFANQGTLAKTGGTGTSHISAMTTSTGTISSSSGTLEFDGGGTFSGSLGGAGYIAFGGGTSTLGGTTGLSATNLLVDGGVVLFTGTQTSISGTYSQTGGTVSIGSGDTLTVLAAAQFGPYGRGEVDGPGTLSTKGTTTINEGIYLGGGLSWNNSGTINDTSDIAGGDTNGGTATLTNLVGASFNITSDYLSIYNAVYTASGKTQTGALTFVNQGTLAKTGGTGTSHISAVTTSTGTISSSSGTLEFDGGGTFSGSLGGAGYIAFGGGTSTLGGTTGLSATNLLVDGGVVLFTGTQTSISGTYFQTDGTVSIGSGDTLTSVGTYFQTSGTLSISSGDTLTVLAAAQFGPYGRGEVDGPGTLSTKGTTTINEGIYLGGGLSWNNSGTINDTSDIAGGDTNGGTATLTNLVGASFNITSDYLSIYNAVYTASGKTQTGALTFVNQGTLAKTGGTGTSHISAVTTSTGTISSSSGTLEFDGGGTFSGSLGGAGYIAFGGGTSTLGGTTGLSATNLLVDGGVVLFTGTQTSISGTYSQTGGTVSIGSGDTLTVLAAAQFGPYGTGEVDGPGTLSTKGTTTINEGIYLGGGLSWNNSGTVNDTSDIAGGDTNGGTATLTNLAGATFNITGDYLSIYNAVYTASGKTQTGALTFVNQGTLAKTGGTGTSTISVALTNTGTVKSQDGTLRLMGPVINAGIIQGAQGGTVDLSGSIIGSGSLEIDNGGQIEIEGADTESVVFTGPGTLRLDVPTKFTGTIYGFNPGAKIVLGGAQAVSIGLQGTALRVGLAGGGAFNLSIAGLQSIDNLSLANNVLTDTALPLVSTPHLAVPSIGAPATTINFGNVRQGSALTRNITVTNAASAPAESLDVTIAAAGAATATGRINLLPQGQSDATDLIAGLNTSVSGMVSGSVTLGFVSDGTTTDGLTATTLPSQTLTLTGVVYQEAQPTLVPPSTLVAHVNDSKIVPLTIGNAAGNVENLLVTVIGTTGSVSAPFGPLSEIAAGATGSLPLTVSTAAAGVVTGTVTLAYASDGAGTDSAPVAATGMQTVNVTATIDNYATLGVAASAGQLSFDGTEYVLNLGTIAQGSTPLSATLSVLNSATGPADLLSGAITVASDQGLNNQGTGTYASLASGAAAVAETIGLATNATGTFSETLVLHGTGSNASGYSGAVADQRVLVTGTVVQQNVTQNVAQLAVSNVSAPTQANAGQPVPISWTLTNQGTEAAVGPWSDEVFLASNAAGDNPQLLGTLTFDGTLTVGQSVTRTLNVSLPATATGNEWFVVRTDALNQVAGDMDGQGRQAVTAAPIDVIASAVTPVSLGDITPDSGSNLGSVTLTLDGANFNANEQVAVVAPDGTTRQATQVRWVSSGKVWATFNLTGLATGAYTVQVSGTTGSATLPSAFTVNSSPAGQLSVNLMLPPTTTQGTGGTGTLTYTNTGDTDIAAPILDVKSTQALIQGPNDSAASDSSLILGTNANGPAGILQPGAQGSVSFTYTPTQSVSQDSVSVSVGIAEPSTTIDWSAYKDALRPATVDATDWNNVWSQFLNRVGTTTDSLTTALAQDATQLSQVGQPTTDVAALLQYELLQASGALAGTYLTAATDIGSTNSSLSLSLNRYYDGTLLNRDATGTFGDGWTSTYDVTAVTDTSGTVYIQSPGVLHVFTLQPDGTYTAQAGDPASLTMSNGLLQMNDGSGDVQRFRSDGQLASITDANGNAITLAYGGNGVLQTVTSTATGETIAFTSNAVGQITTATDSNGRAVTYAYDATGTQLLSASGPGGTTSYTYAAPTGSVQDNALTSVTVPDGAQETFTYDAQGRLATQSTANGVGLETYSYANPGEVTVTDPLGNPTTLLYGADGNVAQIQDALGNVTQLSANAAGDLTSATTAGNSTYRYFYNSNDSLTSYTDPLGGTINVSYASSSQNLTSFANQLGSQTRYMYDASGNVTDITYQDNSGDTYQYNTQGLLIQSKDGDGNVIQYSYDNAGDLTGKTFADGTSDTYAYDTHGNLISAKAQNGDTTSYTYDTDDRLTSVMNSQRQVESYTYNDAGELATRTEPDRSMTQYSYDTYGRLTELQDGSGNLLDKYTFNTIGQLIRTDTGNGASTVFQYDADGHITEILNSNADGSVASRFDYAYNVNGQVIANATSDGNWSYSYDPLGELTHAVFLSINSAIQNQDISYAYDAVGNRVSQTVNGTVTNYTTNALNQYTAVGDTTYTYDADGNIASKTDSLGTSRFTYNQNGQLVSEVNPDETYDYTYDALGNLTSTTQNGTVATYINDPLSLLVGGSRLNAVAEIDDGTGTALSDYEYGIGLAAVTSSAGVTSYYESDVSGNVTGLTNPSGMEQDTYLYSPFGQLIGSVGTDENPFQFAGSIAQLSATDGLVSMRARQYNPQLGRFLTRDPLGIIGGSNLYQYASNDPVNNVDPTGLIVLFQALSSVVDAFGGGVTIGQALGLAAEADAFAAAGFAVAPVLVPIVVAGLALYGGYQIGQAVVNYIAANQSNEFELGEPAELASSVLGLLTLAKFKPLVSLEEKPFEKLSELFKYVENNRPLRIAIGSITEALVDKLSDLVRAIAKAFGCPHFTTYDGLHFDFQGSGEFIAARSTQPGDTFQVQMRIEPEGSVDSAVSIITQIAIQVGTDRVTFGVPQGTDAPRPQVLMVNGIATTIGRTNPVLTLAGGTITEVSTNQYQVALNTGEVVTVNPFGDGMGYSIGLGPNDAPGSVQGFLGPDEGQAKDFQLPDGTVLQQPLTQTQLYQQFANAWRVTDANSLFDYDPGQTTETFTNTMYPREILTLADFSPDLVSKAAALAAAAGITDPTLAADAEFDYLSMGDPSFFSEDATVAQQNPTTPTPAVITQLVTPPPSLGLLPANPELQEASGDTTTVTFLVNLTSAATSDTVVNYTVVHPATSTTGKDFLSADDFGGSLPSGSVTIAAGQTQGTISIDVSNTAIGAAASKWLLATITSPSGNLVYSPAGQTEILNNQSVAGPPADPVIQLLASATPSATSNTYTLTQSGNDYTLDLGTIVAGTVLSPLQFAIANMAMPMGDSLSSNISAATGSGFQVTGASAQETIIAGAAYQNLSFTPQTTSPGTQSTSLTVTSQDVNGSGYSASLPNLTLTVKDMVIAPTQPIVNTLTVDLSEDGYLGDAQAVISVDGVQQGGPVTITASHAAQQIQAVTLQGNFGSGPHVVSVGYFNDADDPGVGDRNLYVDASMFDGTMQDVRQGLYQNGTNTFTVGGSSGSGMSFIATASTAAALSFGAAVADLTGGVDLTAYKLHAGDAGGTIENFFASKGDTLTADVALQGAFTEQDTAGGLLLGFGSSTGTVLLRGLTTTTFDTHNLYWA